MCWKEWKGSVIRGHLCGLRRQSSSHSGAMQFTSMKNRCERNEVTHALREVDKGAEWLRKQSDRPGEMTRCVSARVYCYSTTLIFLLNTFSGHAVDPEQDTFCVCVKIHSVSHVTKLQLWNWSIQSVWKQSHSYIRGLSSEQLWENLSMLKH